MNFADRMKEVSKEQPHDMAIITREDFDRAVEQALEEMTDAMSSKGSAGVLLPIIGLTFAGRMRSILFVKEDK